jgi:hypothetical protein
LVNVDPANAINFLGRPAHDVSDFGVRQVAQRHELGCERPARIVKVRLSHRASFLISVGDPDRVSNGRYGFRDAVW